MSWLLHYKTNKDGATVRFQTVRITTETDSHKELMCKVRKQRFGEPYGITRIDNGQ